MKFAFEPSKPALVQSTRTDQSTQPIPSRVYTLFVISCDGFEIIKEILYQYLQRRKYMLGNFIELYQQCFNLVRNFENFMKHDNSCNKDYFIIDSDILYNCVSDIFDNLSFTFTGVMIEKVLINPFSQFFNKSVEPIIYEQMVCNYIDLFEGLFYELDDQMG